MEIISKYPVKIFKREINGFKVYSIGLNKKLQNGSYINGYIDARFRKDVEIDDSKKIYIKDAWLDFYLDKESKTKLYIFINKFEYVSDVIKDSKVANDPFEEFGNEIEIKDIEINDDMLPF